MWKVWGAKIPDALHWSKMQFIPTKEYPGSGPRRRNRSLSLAVELKLVLWLEATLTLLMSCKKRKGATYNNYNEKKQN